MIFLKSCPEFWGAWNHASLTSVARRNAEIKVGIRKGFSFKGVLSARKYYSLNEVKRQGSYKSPGTMGVLIGNLVGWMWLRSQVYPKHLKFLNPYFISHPRPMGHSFSNFLWEEMIKLGLWTLKQGDVTVKYKKTFMRFRWKVVDDQVYGIANRLKGTGKLQLESIGTKCVTFPEPIEVFHENYYKIKVFNDDIHFSTNLNASVEQIKSFINQEPDIPTTEGCIKDTVEAIITIFGINSLKTPDRGWLTSLMRRMGILLKGWNIYLWDNSFIGMMSTLYYPELATGNIEAICSELTNHGFLPNQAHPLGRAEGITQHPVASYCALRVNEILGEPMENVIPALESNNNWWIQNRDPNGFHLLSYGSELKRRCTAALRQTAQYESGMDNHAMFYKVPMDYESGCMAMYAVSINSIYALDCLSLSQLARINGNAKLAEIMSNRFEKMRNVMNKYLWDGDTYRNRYWNGDFQDELFPSYIFPLIAGIPTQEQATQTVKKVLKKCLTPFGLAPSTLDNRFFKKQITWRGRILPPLQFLASESLRRYEFDLEASDLARRCYRSFHKEWSEESHFHESYNGFTGEGDDVSITGEPSHPWAALLPYLSVQDMIDYEVWNGLRLGRLEPIDASINGIPIQGNKYSVSIQDTTQTIFKNNEKIVSSNYPTILRKVRLEKDVISFKQKALKPVVLEIKAEQGNYNVSVGEEQYKETIDNKGLLSISLKELNNEVNIKKI